MKLKFEYDMELKKADSKNLSRRETAREDRKDKRTELQATQQSEMIAQRKQNLPPKNFAKKKSKVEQLTSRGNMFGPAGLNLIGAKEKKPIMIPGQENNAIPMQEPQPENMQPPTPQNAPPPEEGQAGLATLLTKLQGGQNM